MTTKQFADSINKTALAAKANGQTIEIDYRLPYVDINGNGNVYFFQGEEASNLIEEARKSNLHMYASIENIILFQSQGW